MPKERSPLAAPSPLQKYLDRALTILEKFDITEGQAAQPELTHLLEEVRHIDEPKVLAIAKTIKYIGVFNDGSPAGFRKVIDEHTASGRSFLSAAKRVSMRVVMGLHLHAEMRRHREHILVAAPAHIHHQQIVR